LEPCCHEGKQPPCTDAIIRAGIQRVIFSLYDPNPLVQRKSKHRLQKHGIEVISGILKKQAERLNEIYLHYQKTGMPFVALKVASSMDGKIATENGDSKWITNEKARRYARSLRGEYQAILVGANTAIKDNPHLGARKKGAKDPLRIIIDPHARVPKQAQVFRDENYVHVTDKNFSLQKLLKKLVKQGIISILVEGGSFTVSSFLTAQLAQKVYWFYAPIIIGGTRALPAIQTKDIKKVRSALMLKHYSYKTIGDNMLFEGYF
jgi:diaminohydroxyphosphoribosylaminopyrimidine deaminase/5-amino-6-(5-phosphoribosylamino)uracil reductase